MIQTPEFVFDKNKFIYALDVAGIFKSSLFDCIAKIKTEDIKDKMAFQDVETVAHDVKKFYEL